ncbi:MAG: Mycothiol acetyltransferase [Legionella sp.]|uniref:GNAT family N-acetyltransferase n=1 Tax=Legionella sp. TaxID=459 RepID=UPI003D144743
MNKNITAIRIATIQDAEAISQVHICSWQKMYKEFIPEEVLKNLSLSERTQQWSELINQNVRVLICEMEQQLVGFASICAFRGNSAQSAFGEISAIYLHPDYWRMGLGSQLCLAAMSELVELGYKKVGLWVLEENSQARSFYEALGFKLSESAKFEEFYEGGALLKEVLYVKTL